MEAVHLLQVLHRLARSPRLELQDLPHLDTPQLRQDKLLQDKLQDQPHIQDRLQHMEVTIKIQD